MEGNSMNNPRLATIIIGLAAALPAVTAAAEFALPAYQADYSVARNSLRIGEAHFTLAPESDGSYTYKSVTQPAGLAALFVSDVVTQNSHFDLQGGRPRPL